MKVDVSKILVTRLQVLAKPIESKEKISKSGIYLPTNTTKEKYEVVEIVSLGYAVDDELEKFEKDPIKKGDKCLILSSGATEVYFDTEEKDRELFLMLDFQHLHAKM